MAVFGDDLKKAVIDNAKASDKIVIISGFLFLTLPSGRRLAYVKPRMGENQFGGEAVTYEGVGATKKWECLESYGPKFTENAVQAIARDILMYAMQTLSHCSIVTHVHDEIIIGATAWYLLSLSVSRWAGLHPGQKDYYSVQMVTNAIFIKKIDFRGFDSIGFFAYRQKDDLSFCLFHFKEDSLWMN